MKLYLDSSALVKLVQREPESDSLRRYLRRHRSDQYVTCTLARVEVIRALAPAGTTALVQNRRQLARLDQVALTVDLLDRAANLAPTSLLRSLDAIHLAAAQFAGKELRAVVTYDQRMAAIANQLGLSVAAPK